MDIEKIELFEISIYQIAENAIWLYIVDFIKYSQEEYNIYIELCYEIHLKYAVKEWINDIYLDIFCDDQQNHQLNHKLKRLFYKYQDILSDKYNCWNINHYFNEEYLIHILDNIFNNHPLCLK
jgi:hypothetical protein